MDKTQGITTLLLLLFGLVFRVSIGIDIESDKRKGGRRQEEKRIQYKNKTKIKKNK